MEGWIKLHRKIKESQMYKSLNSKQRDVMIQILLMANFSENEWYWGSDIFKCLPGQFITSLENIAQNCAKDVKIQSVRTALLKLEKWCFLTNESTKTGRLITICKWEDYQIEDYCTNKDINKQPTKLQQSSNKELTTNKECKERKECKEEYIYNKFYDEQLKISNNDKYYLQFIKILFGDNEEKKILTGVLSIKDQLTFNQFNSCFELAKSKNKKISEILLKMENDKKYYKGKISFNVTLKNWINKTFIK